MNHIEHRIARLSSRLVTLLLVGLIQILGMLALPAVAQIPSPVTAEKVFTSSGNWTVPTGVTTVTEFDVIGGGGAGGAAVNAAFGAAGKNATGGGTAGSGWGAGGAAGLNAGSGAPGTAVQQLSQAVSGSVSIVVGSGGATAGATGAQSCFGATCASGGLGGQSYAAASIPVGTGGFAGTGGTGGTTTDNWATTVLAKITEPSVAVNKTVTFTNAAAQSITLGSLSISGTNWTVSAGTCTNGAVLAAGATCTATSTYTNGATATGTASLTLNSTLGVEVVTLSGTSNAKLADISSQTCGTTVASTGVQINGIPVSAAISVVGGKYATSADNSSYSGWTNSAGTINPGTWIKVQGVESTNSNTGTTVTLTIDGTTKTWVATTGGSGYWVQPANVYVSQGYWNQPANIWTSSGYWSQPANVWTASGYWNQPANVWTVSGYSTQPANVWTVSGYSTQPANVWTVSGYSTQPANVWTASGYWGQPADVWTSSGYWQAGPLVLDQSCVTSLNAVFDACVAACTTSPCQYGCGATFMNAYYAGACRVPGPSVWVDTSHWTTPAVVWTDTSHWTTPAAVWTDTSHWTTPAAVWTNTSHWVTPAQVWTDTSHWTTPAAVWTDTSHWTTPAQVWTDTSHWTSPALAWVDTSYWSTPAQVWTNPYGCN